MTTPQAPQARSTAAGVLLVVGGLFCTYLIADLDSSSLWTSLAVALLAAAAVADLWTNDSSSSSTSSSSPEQTLQLIKSRRSVFPKDFSGDNSSITHDKLEQMLDAARWAPTHKLTEPWHFVVIGGPHKAAFEDLTIRLCQELLPPEKAEQTVAKLQRKKETAWPKVHCYIAICMKRHESVPEWEEISAVACAVQNMALQGTALSVRGYWTSWQAPAREAPEMAQLLGIDRARGDRCLGFFVVGCADDERVAGYRPKRQPLEDKVVWMM